MSAFGGAGGHGDKNKNNRRFKTGIDSDDARKKREEVTIELRRNKREEQIQKRRQASMGVAVDPGQAAGGLFRPGEGIADRLAVIPKLVAMLASNDLPTQIDGVTQFRKLLSIERDPPIREVIDSGVVPRLVEFLTHNHAPRLQFEAAWALTNIASGTTQHTRCVIEHGAIQMFVMLLESESADVREQATWALGNIAGDSHTCRDQVLAAGILPKLLCLCTPDAKITMLRNATWTLSNCCRGKPQPRFELVSPALATLANLIYSKDDETLTDACWALSYLSDDTGKDNKKIQAVIESGVARRLVELLMYQSPCVKTPALRAVGNIVTGDDTQTDVMINCAVLPCLLALLINPKKGIRKEACWTLSNITAGNTQQIQAVIDANLIQPLVNVLCNADFDIKKEAAWALSNATSGGNEQQIRYLVHTGAIPPLCQLFACPDPKIVMVAMEGVENILRVGKTDGIANGSNVNVYAEYVEQCNGMHDLEQLQRHANTDVYEKAVKIIQDYLDFEVDDDETLAPAETDGGTQFAFGAGQQPAAQGGAPNAGGFHFGN